MKRILVLAGILIMVLATVVIAEPATTTLQEMYAQAELLMVQSDYSAAAEAFESLGAYSNSTQMAMYCKAINAAENLGLYAMASNAFSTLGDFKDSRQMAQYYNGRYFESLGLIDINDALDSSLSSAMLNCEKAIDIYTDLALFKDSMSRISLCKDKINEIKIEQNRRTDVYTENTYQDAIKLEQNEKYQDALKKYYTIRDYKDCKDRIVFCEYQEAILLFKDKKYINAMELFSNHIYYQDSIEWLDKCKEHTPIQSAIMRQYLGDTNNYTERITYTYDINNCLKSIEVDSILPRHEEYISDAYGRIISSSENGIWGSRDGHSYELNRKYNKYGDIISEYKIYYSSDNEWYKNGTIYNTKNEYTYNVEGFPVEMVSTVNCETDDSTEIFHTTYEYIYNDFGLLKEKYEYVDGELNYEYEFYYDDYTRIKKEVKRYVPAGDLNNYFETTYSYT